MELRSLVRSTASVAAPRRRAASGRAPLGRGVLLCLALLGAPRAAPARDVVPVPPLTGPVVDRAGLLDAADVADLERLARETRAREGGRGVQLQFLVVPSLQGESIESLSRRVVEAWKLGSRGEDNGILVTLSRGDREIRIDVGTGLEGVLTGEWVEHIIDGTMTPAFRAGRYGDGLRDGAVARRQPRRLHPRARARRGPGGRGAAPASLEPLAVERLERGLQPQVALGERRELRRLERLRQLVVGRQGRVLGRWCFGELVIT